MRIVQARVVLTILVAEIMCHANNGTALLLHLQYVMVHQTNATIMHWIHSLNLCEPMLKCCRKKGVGKSLRRYPCSQSLASLLSQERCTCNCQESLRWPVCEEASGLNSKTTDHGAWRSTLVSSVTVQVTHCFTQSNHPNRCTTE
jgi:hypothetical protein